MDFRIRKTDPYLDFFKNQGIQEDLGDPYDPIPEEILRDREFELEEKETPSTWDTIAKWSGLSGLNKEIAQPLLEVPGIKQLTQGIGRTIPAIGETAKHIGDLIAPSDTDLGHSQANESTIPAGPFIGMKGSEILAGARGGLAGAVETIPEVFSLADVTPFGRAAKYAGALGDILSADKAIRGGKALQTGAESLQDLERLSSGINVGISAGQVGQGLEDLDENKAQGLFEIGTGLAGAGLGSKGLTENFISPESRAKAAENLESVFPPTLSQIGPTYKGQEVKILGRRGSTVKIELPDGQIKTVGFSELGKPLDITPKKVPDPKFNPGQSVEIAPGSKVKAAEAFRTISKNSDLNKLSPEELLDLRTLVYKQFRVDLKTGKEYDLPGLDVGSGEQARFEGLLNKAKKGGSGNVIRIGEAPKSKYSDLVKELDEIGGNESLDETVGSEEIKNAEQPYTPTAESRAKTAVRAYVSSLPNSPERQGSLLTEFPDAAEFLTKLTQSELQEKQLPKLYRGVNSTGVEPSGVFESWSTDPQVAAKFGNRILEKVPTLDEVLAYNEGSAWPEEYNKGPFKEGEYLLRRKSKGVSAPIEDTPFINPQDVSIVAPDANILPEYGYPTKPGRPGKQGPPKPPKPPDEFIDEGGGEGGEGPKVEDWLKTAAREVPKIERGQAADIIKDQPFRDQIKLQDQILKEQEMEALKAGKAEEAHKVSLERKILRAQNDEVFQQFKKEEADKVRSEKEQNSYQRRLLKEQEAEDLASRELREKVAGHGQGIKPQTPREWALDFFRVPVAMKASGDIPALSHARYDTLAHPIESFKRLKNEALPAVFSEKKQQEVFDKITQDPMFESAMKAELPFTKQGYDPGAQSFGSYTAENLPVVGHVVKASERGQNVYLDQTRMDRFKQLMDKAGVDNFEQDPKLTKQIADFVGVSTGYGKFDSVKMEQGVRLLNTVMWSTRKRLARAQHLKLLGDALNPKSDMNPVIRKEIARQAVPTIGVGIGLLYLAEQAGAKVDWDWKNSNFAKARFPTKSGKWLSWTPFGDYITTVKLFAQQASGQKTTDKGEYDLDNPQGPFDPTRLSILKDYAYNALNPAARGIVDAIDPRTELEGSPFLDVDEYPNASKALELMTPINASGQGELYNELGPISSLFAPLTAAGEDIRIEDPERFAKMRARAQGKPYSPKKKKGKRKGRVLSLY